MFDKENIQHNLKTGADSDVIFTREVTDNKSPDYAKLKSSEGIYKYPFLARSTGNSIKGSTETIESNELRKGRTKSAPRQGNSSAEGSLDIELSPTTFDDNLEAAFRNKWRPWKSDTDSAINLGFGHCEDGFFITRCTVEGEKDYNPNEDFGKRRLLQVEGEVHDDVGLINVPAGCIVHELTCGTKDIKYSVLKKFGGVDNEDLYQEFKHMAVNTLSLDVQIGAIVTGSFGFMGNNNPKLLTEDKAKDEFGGDTSNRFEDGKTTGNSYIDNLPEKSTDTDQFTSREGNLWINGKNITFAESLSMELNNGLEKKFAIFVKNAISTQPLTLDVTGDLSTYLVEGESDQLYNLGIDDATNELMFCFQDKEYDPTFIYLFQIFKMKIGDQDLSASGADTFSQSHPWSSFEERAVRVFRIALPKAVNVTFEPAETWTNPGTYFITPNVELEKPEDVTGISVKSVLKDNLNKTVVEKTIEDVEIENGIIKVAEPEFTPTETTTAVSREVTVILNGDSITRSFIETDAPAAPTNFSAEPASKQLTISWVDSISDDVDHYEIELLDDKTSVAKANVGTGVQTYVAKKLTNDTIYTVNIVAVDVHNNRSEALSGTGTPAEPLP